MEFCCYSLAWRTLLKTTIVFFCAGISVALFLTPVFAESKDQAEELRDLKKRVERLESERDNATTIDGTSVKQRLVQSTHGIKISGGLTATAEGTNHLKNGRHRGAVALSADLSLETAIGKDGKVAAAFDIQSGAGLKNLPPLFTSPNGNATGVNNDIESYNNDSAHLTQLYYERDFNKKVVITVGKLDLPTYFDVNNFAGNERTQFLANSFVSNPAVEFGGTQDFNGSGARVTGNLSDSLDITFGAFEGDGNFNDAFDRPFLMAETDFKAALNGKDGNYRFYVWTRQGRPDAMSTADPRDERLARSANNGVGLSFDQQLTEIAGVWLRAGVQRQKLAQFDRHISTGVNVKAPFAGRESDVFGAGYGVTFTGAAYENYMSSAAPQFKAGAEHYLEAYYNFAVAHATAVTGAHISPDIQLVINPGGDMNMTNLFVYGLRLQVFF
ncbi:hypothetical protein EPN18_05780 [bacterium]|nr:MAG: hypothetical protein EPN18_05780 [bacterium]